MRLGALITKLEAMDPELPIRFDFGGFVPTSFASYRGYYDQVALGFDDESTETVGGLLKKAKVAVGAEFYGYKGGTYRMDSATQVWVDNYGRSTGTRLVGVRDAGWCAVLLTEWDND